MGGETEGMIRKGSFGEEQNVWDPAHGVGRTTLTSKRKSHGWIQI